MSVLVLAMEPQAYIASASMVTELFGTATKDCNLRHSCFEKILFSKNTFLYEAPGITQYLGIIQRI